MLHPQDHDRPPGGLPRPPPMRRASSDFRAARKANTTPTTRATPRPPCPPRSGWPSPGTRREKHHVIAVVGDGSLTGGVACGSAEPDRPPPRAADHRPQRQHDVDLGSVGALSKYLSYLASGQHYLRIKDQAKSILKSIPKIGWPMIKAGRAVEELVKKTFFPGLVFEELGLRYVGPVQGHSLESLVEVFETAKKYDGPFLIQCVTRKGQGLRSGRDGPRAFPRRRPFQIPTGEPAAPRRETVLFLGFRPNAHGQARPGRRQGHRHHRGHAARGPGYGVRGEASRPVLRRRHRRAACRHFRRRPGGSAASSPSAPSIRPSSSGPTTRSTTTSASRTCRSSSLWTGPGSCPTTVRPTRASTISPIFGTCPTSSSWLPRRERAAAYALVGALLRPSGCHPLPQGQGAGRSHGRASPGHPAGKERTVKDGRDLLFAFGHMVRPALEAADALEKEGIIVWPSSTPVSSSPSTRRRSCVSPGRARRSSRSRKGCLAGGVGSAVRELLDREGLFDIRFKAIGLPLEAYPLARPTRSGPWSAWTFLASSGRSRTSTGPPSVPAAMRERADKLLVGRALAPSLRRPRP